MHDNTGIKRDMPFLFIQKLYIYFNFYSGGRCPALLSQSSSLMRRYRTWADPGTGAQRWSCGTWDIAWRKLETNYRLRYSSGADAFFIFLVIFLYYYPVGLPKRFNETGKAAIGGIIRKLLLSCLMIWCCGGGNDYVYGGRLFCCSVFMKCPPIPREMVTQQNIILQEIRI